jgi:hypothetical protein
MGSSCLRLPGAAANPGKTLRLAYDSVNHAGYVQMLRGNERLTPLQGWPDV